MAQNALLENILKPREQWAMSSADNVWGMSLPEYHPEDPALPTSWDKPEWADVADDSVQFSATDTPEFDMDRLIDALTANNQRQPDDLSKAIATLFQGRSDLKTLAKGELQAGTIYKIIGAASDFFSRATGIIAGQEGLIKGQVRNVQQSYQNEMDALDNQVLYIKNQLADRFNKTIETNTMRLAAQNLRVNAGNVLELSKDEAQEITEDMRMAESNAKLKQIALEAGQKSAKEAGKHAIKQMWTGLVGSAAKLGLSMTVPFSDYGNLFAGKESLSETVYGK